MITIVPGPLTLEAKRAAIQKEVRAIFESYFAKAATTRVWFPARLPQRNEMAKYGSRVSDETRDILLGFLGVESFVDDYVAQGIQVAGNSATVREIYIQWGFEEKRHGQTLRHCLIDSGLYPQDWVDRYLTECAEDQWTFERQTGYEATPLLASAYAIFQERQTRKNYTIMRMRLWEEYGRPEDRAGRRLFPAIAGAIRFVETDEGAHEAHFSNLTSVYLKYMPDQTLEALMKVSSHYRMPIIQIPNGEEFVRAVHSIGMDSPRDVISQVMTPALTSMGLESRLALRKAVENFKNMPEGAVLQLPGKPIEDLPEGTASVIYEMKPTGEFVLVGAAPQAEE